jgi:GNAT superfamily N-acetyltransferase
MSFVEIDYNNSLHVECLWALIKRNRFHMQDFYALLYGKFYMTESMKNGFTSMGMNQETQEKLCIDAEAYIKSKMYKDDEDCKGIFICDGKKPVGFLLYYIRKTREHIDLSFLLVDKKKQKQGYGTQLLQQFWGKVRDMDPIIVVKVDDDSSARWYAIHGFCTQSELIANCDDRKKKSTIYLEQIINPSIQKKLFYVFTKKSYTNIVV